MEDTKGNPGEEGVLMFTNLRVLWLLRRDRRTNLSIGLDTLVSITVKASESRLTGAVRAAYLLTKFNQSRCACCCALFSVAVSPPPARAAHAALRK